MSLLETYSYEDHKNLLDNFKEVDADRRLISQDMKMFIRTHRKMSAADRRRWNRWHEILYRAWCESTHRGETLMRTTSRQQWKEYRRWRDMVKRHLLSTPVFGEKGLQI